MKQTGLQGYKEIPDTTRFDGLEHWLIVIREPGVKPIGRPFRTATSYENVITGCAGTETTALPCC